MIEPTDKEVIRKWLIDRQEPNVERVLELLPSNGLIVDGLIAWHYWITVDNIAIMEGLITNPNASVRERIAGARELFTVWNALANQLHIKRYIYMTDDRDAYDWYSKMNGSTRIGTKYRMYMREL